MNHCRHDIVFLKRCLRSRDATNGSSQVAALVVDVEAQIMGEGVSRLPPGTTFIEDASYLDKVIHAEVTAIGDRYVRGGTIYVTRMPCKKCAELIVERGIKRVVYIEENTNDPGLGILSSNNIQVDQVVL